MKNNENSKLSDTSLEICSSSNTLCYSSSKESSNTTIRNSTSDNNNLISTMNPNHKLLNQNQIEYYIHLLKEAKLSIFSRDALIELLKQQFDHIDYLYQISLSNIEDINHKYKLTKIELDCLKSTSEKYTNDIEILIRDKNEKRLNNSEKQYSPWLQQFQKMNNNDQDQNLKNKKDDFNINNSNQYQNQKSQQLMKQLDNNNTQMTSSMQSNNENVKRIEIQKLLKENEGLKQELNEMKSEHERLLNYNNKSGNISQETTEIKNLLDKVEILNSKVNNLYENKMQIKQQNEEEREIFPEGNIAHEDSIDSQSLNVPRTSFLDVRDSLTKSLDHNFSSLNLEPRESTSADSITDFTNLRKENATLQELILKLQHNQNNEDEIETLTIEIVHLKQLLKHKTEELKSVSSDANLTGEDDVIQQLREKQILFQRDYKETVEKNNILSDQLSQQSDKVNKKIILIRNLQEEMNQLRLEFEQKQLTNETNKLNEELNEKFQTLQQSLETSKEETKGYCEEISKHNNCQQRIHELNVELAEKTILIAKLKSDYTNARQAKYNKEQVEYKNKINALTNVNAELQNQMYEKDEEITGLETLNKELTEKLKIAQADYERDAKHQDKSLNEISSLFKNKEDEVLKTTNSVKNKEENLEKLQRENDALRKLLEDRESSLKLEHMNLGQDILEQQRKNDTLENLTDYASKINDLEELNEEYMNTIKGFSNICNLLNKKNEEVMDIKSILNILLENMESNFSNLNNNELNINTVQIDNMIKCIRKYYKSDLNGQNISKNNLDDSNKQFCGKNCTGISNQLVKFSECDPFYTNNVKDLLLERDCLHRNLNSVNEKLKLALQIPNKSSLCICNKVSLRKNFCSDNILERIPNNNCWIHGIDLITQMATDIHQIKQFLMPPKYENGQNQNKDISNQVIQVTCKSLQNYVASMKKLLENAFNILDDIGKIESSL